MANALISSMYPSMLVRTPLSLMTGSVTAFQILMTLTSFHREANTKPAPYSKFSSGGTLTGRQGMLVIYAPAFLLTCYIAASNNFNLIPTEPYRPSILADLLLIHFGKRIIETLFLHSYSKGVEASTAIAIGVYYSIVCAIILFFNMFVDVASAAHVYSPRIFLAGISLFAVGEVGNWYHHYLLAKLRVDDKGNNKNNNNNKKNDAAKTVASNYVLPRGGLFPLVTMPHYFFELVAWLGIALVSQQLNTFLVFSSMASYLAGRSVATSEWYKKNLDNYPSKKHLVPFLF